MSQESALLWWWLSILTRKRYAVLQQRFSSLDDALAALSPTLLQELGLREETIRRTFVRIEEFDPAAVVDRMRTLGVQLVTMDDETYPRLLREIPDAPVILSYRGDLSILDQPTVAVVGTRRMSDYGRRVTEEMVPALVRAGLVTISGLALGVDALAARETLRSGGRTVAVPGGGLAHIAPQTNARLARDIVEKGGLLLSEFPLDMQPDKYAFPARNRVIAGLALATVVLEAPAESGSLITARLAAEYNRDVCAVPGPVFEPTCAGCHALIAAGEAQLVASAEDVLRQLGVVSNSLQSTLPAFTPDSPDEAAVYAVLTTMPQSLDILKERTQLPASQIGAALTMLELAGAVRNVGAGQWVRCA